MAAAANMELERDSREEKLIVKAVSMGFSERESKRLLKLYGGQRMTEILKRAKVEGGVLGSKVAMTNMARVAMADSMYQEMCTTQGISWVKIVDGVKVKLRLDLLMIYNGTLRGPKVSITNRAGRGITIETHGIGMILNTKGNWAMFGLVPPNGKEWSEWQPCFFASDPVGKQTYTLIKSVADGCDTTKEQREVIQEMGFNLAPVRKGPTGLPIALLKRAANDTIKLAGFDSKPGWQDGIDLRDGEHPENAIALVKDERAKALLEQYWFSDSADTEEDEENAEDEDIWS